MSYIILDCEMGSVDLEYSLLSVYIMAVDNNFQKTNELNLLVMPDDGKFVVQGEAMRINKINLAGHSIVAKPYKEAGTILYKWLDKLTDDGKNKVTPIGHGIVGDIKFIQRYLISRGSWEKFVSYRNLDTSSVCQFLKSVGLFPEEVSGSLVSLAKHFKVEVDENAAHDAKYDTQLTFKVFLALRKMFVGTPI